MSIFGTTYPKFVQGATTVNLENAILTPNWPIPEIVEQQSILTGEKSFVVRGSHAEFDVLVHLFKYASPGTTAETMLAYNNTIVDQFYPFANGNYLMDESSNAVKCFLSMKLASLDKLNKFDTMIITVKTINYFDITKGVL